MSSTDPAVEQSSQVPASAHVSADPHTSAEHAAAASPSGSAAPPLPPTPPAMPAEAYPGPSDTTPPAVPTAAMASAAPPPAPKPGGQGWLIGGSIAGGVVVLALTFGGGFAVGAHVATPGGPGLGQNGPAFGPGQQGERPDFGDRPGPGDLPEQRDGSGSGDSGSSDGS